MKETAGEFSVRKIAGRKYIFNYLTTLTNLSFLTSHYYIFTNTICN